MMRERELARELTTSARSRIMLAVALATGCASSTPTSSPDADGTGTLAAIAIAPKSSHIAVGQVLTFHAVGRSNLGDSVAVSVEWSATGGTVSSAGAFTSTVPGTFKVIGRANAGSRPPADTAVVVVDSVGGPVVTSLTVTPATATLVSGQTQAFTATARYSDDHTATLTTGLNWTATGGTITGDGKYTAGAMPGTFAVHAVSGDVQGSASVTVRMNAAAKIDTIFQETFESGSKAAWTDEASASLHTIVSEAGAAHAGTHALRVTFPANVEPGYMAHWFMPGYDSVYVRYWFRLDANWVGNTKLFNLAGNRVDDMWSGAGGAGVCPTGYDFFRTGIVMPTAAPNAAPTALTLYTYYPGMPKQSDGMTCWGSEGRSVATYSANPPSLSRGVWHQVEFWVKLNTPDRADGAQRVWLDGQLIIEWPNLMLRRTSDLRLNKIQMGFSHAGAFAASVDRVLYVDDIIVLSARP